MKWIHRSGETMHHIRGNLWFLALTFGYAAAAWAITRYYGAPDLFVVPQYAVLWTLAVLTAIIFGSLVIFIHGFLVDYNKPLTTGWRVSGFTFRDLAGGAIVFYAFGIFYGAFTTVKTTLPIITPFHADAMLADVDRMLHGGMDPRALLEPLMRPGLVAFIDLGYTTIWTLLSVCVPAFVIIWPCFRGVRNRFLITYAASWIFLGNVLALVFFSAGPIYYGNVTGDHGRFSEINAYMAANSHLSANLIQNYLWHAYTANRGLAGTGISAFPSLHIAMCTLYLALALHFRKKLAITAAATFLVMILVGSVHFGWHYAVDGYVSITFVLVVWYLTGVRVTDWKPSPRPARAIASVGYAETAD